ncbi:MAG: capsid cement protein [Ilumatobacteraceae bacterium]
MPGPNMVLDKGYIPTTATRQFRVVVAGAKERCAEASAAGAIPLGVCQEEIAAADVAVDVERVAQIRLAGISRCIADAALGIGVRVRVDAQGRVTALAAATLNQNVVGITTTASAAAGDHIDVLLAIGSSIGT